MKGEHLKFGSPCTCNAFQTASSSEASPKTETELEKGRWKLQPLWRTHWKSCRLWEN